MQKTFVILSFVLSLVLVLTGLLIYFQRDGDDPSVLKISGNIELTQVEVGFQIPGKIQKRLVDEGEMVEEGQIVATLDMEDLVHKARLREAELAEAQAKLLELTTGYLPEEIAKAEAQVLRSVAELKNAKRDFKRQKQLFNEEVISQREYEASLSLRDIAEAKYLEAMEQLALLKRGIRQEIIDQAQAKVNQAKEAWDLAQIKLSYATIRSPITGFVLTKNAEPGEYVQAGTPVVTVGNLVDPWLRAYINETDLGRVKLGQKVTITTDTFPDKEYEGKISFISSEAEFTPKNVQTEKERVKLVYRIKIDIPNPEMELKLGMPADGYIQLNRS